MPTNGTCPCRFQMPPKARGQGSIKSPKMALSATRAPRFPFSLDLCVLLTCPKELLCLIEHRVTGVLCSPPSLRGHSVPRTRGLRMHFAHARRGITHRLTAVRLWKLLLPEPKEAQPVCFCSHATRDIYWWQLHRLSTLRRVMEFREQSRT